MTALKVLFGLDLVFRGARNPVQDQDRDQALSFFSWLFVLVVSSGGNRVQPLYS